MKCSECNCEIINFPESKDYCRECEESFIAKFIHGLKSMNREEKLDVLKDITVELISRNKLPD